MFEKTPSSIESKAKEFRQHIEAANICIRELIEMGARPEIDKVEVAQDTHPGAFLLIPRVMMKVDDE